MRLFKITLLLFVVAASLASCKSYSKTAVTSNISGPTIIQKPVIADLDVKEKRVEGTATGKGSADTEALKKAAVNDALNKSNADVLIEPRYEISIEMNQAKVTVTGYPGTYKNFRSMEPSDTLFMHNKVNALPQTDRSEAPRSKARRNRIIGMSVGGFFGAILLAGIVALII